jgi:hypothetical protein
LRLAAILPRANKQTRMKRLSGYGENIIHNSIIHPASARPLLEHLRGR